MKKQIKVLLEYRKAYNIDDYKHATQFPVDMLLEPDKVNAKGKLSDRTKVNKRIYNEVYSAAQNGGMSETDCHDLAMDHSTRSR